MPQPSDHTAKLESSFPIVFWIWFDPTDRALPSPRGHLLERCLLALQPANLQHLQPALKPAACSPCSLQPHPGSACVPHAACQLAALQHAACSLQPKRHMICSRLKNIARTCSTLVARSSGGHSGIGARPGRQPRSITRCLASYFCFCSLGDHPVTTRTWVCSRAKMFFQTKGPATMLPL